MYGTHELLVVLAISLPVLEALVKVEESVVLCTSKEHVPDKDFSQDSVECGFCVQKECKHWKFCYIQRVLDYFSKKKSRVFMRHSRSLELGRGLLCMPIIKTELTDIKIQSFSYQRTS